MSRYCEVYESWKADPEAVGQCLRVAEPDIDRLWSALDDFIFAKFDAEGATCYPAHTIQRPSPIDYEHIPRR